MILKTQVKIDPTQDGELIDDKLIKKYGLNKNDIFYSKEGNPYTNFVGVVHRGTDILVSLPKHFMKTSTFDNYDEPDKKKYIKLIMDSINASVRGYQKSDHQVQDKSDTTFAIAAYFKVYEYFAKYGLYHVAHHEIKPFSGNKIVWKETLRRSTKFISNGNLIFSPIFYKKKRTDETLITDCMVFIINYTSQLFNDFMTLPSNAKIASRGVKSGILGNNAVIYKLQEILSRTFKDIDQQLIRNIIVFLQRVNSSPRQVPDIKYYNYSSVWEQAVQKYLNNHFQGVDEHNNMQFASDNINGERFVKEPLHYNTVKRYRDWYLEPDHLLIDEGRKRIYILDSKYYKQIKDLNHKQFVYHVLLSNKYSEFEIFDSLVIPSEGSTKTEEYVNIDSKYLLKQEKPITIYLTYLNMIDVLKNYVN